MIMIISRHHNRVGRWRWCGHGCAVESLLLTLTSLMVLEPVKDVLALDLTVLSQPCSDLLDLIGCWWPDSTVVVKFFEDSDLLRRRCPPRAGLATRVTTRAGLVVVVVAAFLVGLMMMMLMLWWLHVCLIRLFFTKLTVNKIKTREEQENDIEKEKLEFSKKTTCSGGSKEILGFVWERRYIYI